MCSDCVLVTETSFSHAISEYSTEGQALLKNLTVKNFTYRETEQDNEWPYPSTSQLDKQLWTCCCICFFCVYFFWLHYLKVLYRHHNTSNINMYILPH